MRLEIMLSLLLLVSFIYPSTAQPSVKSGEGSRWYLNLETAKVEALKEDKKILIVFSGSDWCKPCIQLREQILNTNEFQQFADQTLILVRADFPRLRKNQLSKEQSQLNEDLAELYNKQGTFPWIVITNANGKVISQTGFQNETLNGFISRIKSILN